jgi:hypothetical protein
MKTYLFSGDLGQGAWRFEEILRERGYVPYDGDCAANGVLQPNTQCNIDYVDLLYVNHFKNSSYDPNTYNIKCDWHSRHDAKTVYPICRKDRLHSSIPEWCAKTWPIESFQYVQGVYIIRPSHMLMAAGKDIRIVDSAESFASAKEFYAVEAAKYARSKKEHMQYYRVIVSEYITDPMLFEGRKFHLRLHGINLSTREGFWIAREHGRIFTAAKPFIMSDFEDKSIHDTHNISTPRDLFFPEDFPAPELLGKINTQLDAIEKALAKLSSPRPYPQARRSFQVYGIDLMVRTDGTIVLIELNERPAHPVKDPKDLKVIRAFTEHGNWLGRFIFPSLRSYLFSGDADYVWADLREILKAKGYSPHPDGEYVRGGILQLKDGKCGIARVDFLFSSPRKDAGYDPNVYDIFTDWQSIHEHKSRFELVHKDRLHERLRGTDFVAKTRPFDQFQYDDGTYVIRPLGPLAFSGFGEMVVDSRESWENARGVYNSKISAHSQYHKRPPSYYRVIVSEHVANLLLFEGHKFHLQLYGINFSDRSGFWIARNCGKMSVESDTQDTLLYPEKFPEQGLLELINRQLNALETALAGLTTPTPRQQAARSFEIYELVFVVDSAGKITLLEINDHVNFTVNNSEDPDMKRLARLRSEWLASFLFP